MAQAEFYCQQITLLFIIFLSFPFCAVEHFPEETQYCYFGKHVI
jgi:hypothetical protein